METKTEISLKKRTLVRYFCHGIIIDNLYQIQTFIEIISVLCSKNGDIIEKEKNPS